jgi:hypothetical protein
MNTAGNTLADIDMLMTDVGAVSVKGKGMDASPSPPAPVSRRSLQGRGRPGSARRLGTLSLVASNATSAPDRRSSSVVVTVNVVMRSSAEARALVVSLKAEGARAGALLRSLSDDAGALSSSVATSIGGGNATIDASSVRTVTLIFQKSYWALFLEWLLRNAYNVITGCAALAAGFGLLLLSRRIGRRRAELIALNAAKLKALRLAIHDSVVRARGDKIRAARWRYVRERLLTKLIPASAFIEAGRLRRSPPHERRGRQAAVLPRRESPFDLASVSAAVDIAPLASFARDECTRERADERNSPVSEALLDIVSASRGDGASGQAIATGVVAGGAAHNDFTQGWGGDQGFSALMARVDDALAPSSAADSTLTAVVVSEQPLVSRSDTAAAASLPPSSTKSRLQIAARRVVATSAAVPAETKRAALREHIDGLAERMRKIKFRAESTQATNLS